MKRCKVEIKVRSVLSGYIPSRSDPPPSHTYTNTLRNHTQDFPLKESKIAQKIKGKGVPPPPPHTHTLKNRYSFWYNNVIYAYYQLILLAARNGHWALG